jgi:thiol:disulfide interchange protein DsbA
MKKILLAGLSLAFTLQAQAAPALESGTQYQNIVPAQTPKDLPIGKVEVTEFFWYGCSHCYDFEPHLNDWVNNKPKNVVFKRIPAIFNKGWVIHAKAYYAAEMLGITDKTHPAIFLAIHKDKNSLSTSGDLAELMSQASGVEKQIILDTINSFAVETKSRQAIQAGRLHGLRGVPAVAVNGKFLTSGRQAGDYPTMVKVMDFLVAKESQ